MQKCPSTCRCWTFLMASGCCCSAAICMHKLCEPWPAAAVPCLVAEVVCKLHWWLCGRIHPLHELLKLQARQDDPPPGQQLHEEDAQQPLHRETLPAMIRLHAGWLTQCPSIVAAQAWCMTRQQSVLNTRNACCAPDQTAPRPANGCRAPNIFPVPISVLIFPESLCV